MRFNLLAVQKILTICITVVAFLCMLNDWELYPFAPYTMYSYKHSIKDMTWQKIGCIGNETFELTNEMINPFDEARLATSLERSHFSNDPLIVNKLTDLKSIIIKNGYECEKVRLQFVRYKSAEDYLAKRFYLNKEYLSL